MIEQVRNKTLDDFQKLSGDLSTSLLGFGRPSQRKKRRREEQRLLREKRQVLFEFLGIKP